MADEKYTFAQARVRLEEIVGQVRDKDVSLEKSIELLEEGVRLANQCTELSDHTEWQSVAREQDQSDPSGNTDDDVTSDQAPEAVEDDSQSDDSSENEG